MKILKKFGSFINEDLENMPMDAPMEAPISPETTTSVVDETEEEEEDKYGKMLKELAEALATKVVKDEKTGALCVKYKGKTINVYSEDDKYHVDKKKFTSYQEVVNYLTGSKTMSKQEFRKEIGNMENTLDDMSNDLEEIEEDEEMLEEGWRDDMDMNPDHFDDEDDSDVCPSCDCNPCECEYNEDICPSCDCNPCECEDDMDMNPDHFDDEDDEDVCPSCDCNPCECEDDMDMNPDYFGDEDDEDICPSCDCNPCECEYNENVCPSCDCNPCECEEDEDEELLTGERAGERRIGMDESHLTKRFKDFK